MIEITSYLHREALRDLIKRWMYHELQPEDPALITQLVHFNNTFVSRTLDHFSRTLLTSLYGEGVEALPVRKKSNIKDAIIENPHYRTPRIGQLIRNYRARPEHYYGDTPVHGLLYFSTQFSPRRFVCASRIKRVRRLAEKIARRIIDFIFLAIKERADALADDRARLMGIPRDELVSPEQTMVDEFGAAERRLLEDLRAGRPIYTPRMVIDDVAGIKIIIDDKEQQHLIDIISQRQDCQIVEIEPHTGRYNATNIIVQHRPPKALIIEAPLAVPLLSVLQKRGVAAVDAHRDFTDFVLSGEDTVNIEVITSNYQEVIESEIGRCMHEDRIIEQRRRQEYRGHLAKNIEYLVQYLFAFGNSPKQRIEELPIKLWSRYLPDYIDEVLKALYDIPSPHLVDS